jgi:hypothetical protein
LGSLIMNLLCQFDRLSAPCLRGDIVARYSAPGGQLTKVDQVDDLFASIADLAVTSQ